MVPVEWLQAIYPGLLTYVSEVKSPSAFHSQKSIAELCSMLCGSLDGRGIGGRMDTYICMAKSHRYSPEISTTLFTGYTDIQNKKLKRNRLSLKKKVNIWICSLPIKLFYSGLLIASIFSCV